MGIQQLGQFDGHTWTTLATYHAISSYQDCVVKTVAVQADFMWQLCDPMYQERLQHTTLHNQTTAWYNGGDSYNNQPYWLAVVSIPYSVCKHTTYAVALTGARLQ